MKICTVIQARLGSTRFPEKMLYRFNGKTLLEHVIDAVSGDDLPPVCVATPLGDEKLRLICRGKSCYWCGGDEHNVLKRVRSAAVAMGADKIIRVCGDSPAMPSFRIRELCNYATRWADADYIGYKLSYDGLHVPAIQCKTGVFPELCSVKALSKVLDTDFRKDAFEHVTYGLYCPVYLEQYRCRWIYAGDSSEYICKNIDTPADIRNLEWVSA